MYRWLIERPSDDFFSGSLRAIRAVYGRVDPAAQEVASRTFLDYCAALVRLTGGLYGLDSKVSREEGG
jgi:hypothetical protein